MAGFGILPGAWLELLSPNSSVAPLVNGPFDQVPTIEFRLPLHPTSEVLQDGRRVWQTAAEVEPLVLYELMLGGPKAMGVPEALDPTTVLTIDEEHYTAGHFNPLANLHYVRVQNPDGLSSSLGNGGWQPLTLQ